MSPDKPMAAEDLLRRLYVARDRGDTHAVVEMLAPEVEAHTSPANPDQVVERGPEGFVMFLERWAAAWAKYQFDPDEFVMAGDRVLVLGSACAQPHGSAIVVEQFVAHLWTIRDGCVTRLQVFHDRDAAFKGLRGD